MRRAAFAFLPSCLPSAWLMAWDKTCAAGEVDSPATTSEEPAWALRSAARTGSQARALALARSEPESHSPAQAQAWKRPPLPASRPTHPSCFAAAIVL